ncbi:MAG: biotin/lipoyl-binding protein [Candidatus Paceibacterota bacterium]
MFFIIGLIVLLIIIISNSKKGAITSVIIVKGTVTQEVSLTGTVKPIRNIDYAFDRSGRVSKIYVNTGDVVKQGQILISLDNADVYAQYQQAKSALKIQQIKLTDYYNGVRSQDLQITQNQFNDAQQKLDAAYKDMYSDLFSNYQTINNLMRVSLVSVFNYMGN